MWRVILRISYTSDLGSGLRNNVVALIQSLGLQHTATGTFEYSAVDQSRPRITCRRCFKQSPIHNSFRKFTLKPSLSIYGCSLIESFKETKRIANGEEYGSIPHYQ